MNIDTNKSIDFFTYVVPLINILISLILGGLLKYYFDNKLSTTNNSLNKELEKYKAELEKYKHKLDLEKRRKILSTETQKDILFIFQNLFNHVYTKEDDFNKRLNQLILDTKNTEINRGNYKNSIIKLMSAIGINSFSPEVAKIRLGLQEMAYELHSTDNQDNNFDSIVAYSLMYKYLYLEYIGIEVDDLYYLKYYLNDFKKNETQLELAKERILKKFQL